MNFIKNFVAVFAFIIVALMLISIGGMSSKFSGMENVMISKPSILLVKLEGVIMDGKSVLDPLRKYAKEKNIKGVLIQISSPGGVVGPSQEIYSEILHIKNVLKKPVYVTCNAMAASGGYYAAVAGSKIFTNPGTLMGSIGVIMEFADASELYKFAKVTPVTIKSGNLKDAGSSSRAMTEVERQYFQELIDGVQTQFVQAIQSQRKLSEQIVTNNSDGRVFTGAQAVELGFADEIGSYTDALRALGEVTKLGTSPKVFVPPKPVPSLSEFLAEVKSPVLKTLGLPFTNKLELVGKPLSILPGTL